MPLATLNAQFDNIPSVVRSLNAIADGLGDELAAGIRDDQGELLALTAGNTPIGPGPQGPGDPLPHMASMYAIGVDIKGNSINVIAHHPGAKVFEWGGTIAPHKNKAGTGGEIHIAQHAQAYRAGITTLPTIERSVKTRIDRLIASH